MLKKLKEFWDKLKKTAGTTVSEEKEKEIEKLLEEFAKTLEAGKEGEGKEEGDKKTDPAGKKDDFDIAKEFVKLTDSLKAALKPPDAGNEDEKPKPNDPSEAITNALKPFVDAMKTQSEQMTAIAKRQADGDKGAIDSKVKSLLESSYKAGKFSSKEISFYKEQLEANFGVASKIINKLSKNAVVAKQNEKAKFSLDAAADDDDKNKDDSKEKKVDPAKHYDTAWAGTVDKDILRAVEDSISEN